MVDKLALDIHEENEDLLALTWRLHRHYHPDVPDRVPPDNQLMSDLVRNAVRKYPRRIATDFFGQTQTFTEIDTKIRRTAAYLRHLGVREGDVVGLVAPNCPQFVEVFYAAAHLGAITALHNPLAPPTQLNEQVINHGARIVIVWDRVWDSVSVRGVKKIALSLIGDMPRSKRLALRLPIKKAQEAREALSGPVPKATYYLHEQVRKFKPLRTRPTQVAPTAPVALLHTGGTTGLPKACILTHRNLMSNVEVAAIWVVNLREGKEVFYEALPFFHAFGLTLTMNAFFRMGATAVIFPKFDEKLICDAMKRRPGTFFLGVPPMFKRLAAAAERNGTDLSSIRFAISGAMPLSKEIAAEWERVTGGYLVEGYGMTETSPIVLGSPFSSKRRPGTMGLPFPSIGVRIVDPENPTVDMPVGAVGELLVKGPNCSPGYWNDPQQSAELYTEEGWLRTGDLVRVDDDFIVMTDRRKELIISAGFNVYPSEVEKAIRSLPEVDDVAVVGLPDPARGEQVVAAIVPRPGAKITLEQIREHAAEDISRYALPRRMVIMDKLPHSQIGKVVRRAVREEILKRDAENA